MFFRGARVVVFSRGPRVGTVPETHWLCWLNPQQRGQWKVGGKDGLGLLPSDQLTQSRSGNISVES